jgi:hypothetical protein
MDFPTSNLAQPPTSLNLQPRSTSNLAQPPTSLNLPPLNGKLWLCYLANKKNIILFLMILF